MKCISKIIPYKYFFTTNIITTSKSNNTTLKSKNKPNKTHKHDIHEHLQLFKKIAQRAFTWHLQAFTIISKDEAKVIHMIHIQELNDSPKRIEKRRKKI